MSSTAATVKRRSIQRSPSIIQTQTLSSREHDGSCWTCVARGTYCDKGLPLCETCAQGGYVCEGYSTRLHWNTTFNRKPRTSSTSDYTTSNGDLPRVSSVLSPEGIWDTGWPRYRRHSSLFANWVPEHPIIATSTTPLERRYLRHFLTHVCRVATAIDEASNGLRTTILPMAASDPALLNTILAVSSQHMGSWNNRVDPLAASFLSTALKNLRKNLANPASASSQATIATTFLLATHEIFNASTSTWRTHLRGAGELIRFRGGSSDIHPDIKRSLFMLDLQSALNVGEGFFYDSEQWMEDEIDGKRRELDMRPDWPIYAIEPGRREACIIDTLLGTSTKLLSVLAKAARLYQFSRHPPSTGLNTTAELLSRGSIVQAELHHISLKDVPLSAIMICTTSDPLSSTPPVIDTDILEESIVTSEIFRNCALIYTFRVMMGDNVPLDARTQEALEEAFRLLPRVPDAQGPGSILGWSITVMGCELSSKMEEEREYLRCRWGGIHGLGLKHSLKAAELLEAFPSRFSAYRTRRFGDGEIEPRKLVGHYIQGPLPLSDANFRFQDVSRDLGWELVLI